MGIVFKWRDAVAEEEVKSGTNRKILAVGKGIQIIRYDKESGGVTPEHSHPEELIGILIKGKQEAILNGEKMTILPFTNVGDETCVTLDIVSPPRISEAYKKNKK
jgi:hypothetical protein